jgi:hypothetical protein
MKTRKLEYFYYPILGVKCRYYCRGDKSGLWLLLWVTVPSIDKHFLLLGNLQISINHHFNKVFKSNLWFPVECTSGLGRITPETVHLSRSEIPAEHRKQNFSLLKKYPYKSSENANAILHLKLNLQNMCIKQQNVQNHLPE